MESTSFLRESYSFALYRWSSLTTRLLFLALDPTPTFLPSKRFGTPLQEAHCNFYLSELLACRTRGLARLQIGARSWDLASLEDGRSARKDRSGDRTLTRRRGAVPQELVFCRVR